MKEQESSKEIKKEIKKRVTRCYGLGSSNKVIPPKQIKKEE